MSSAGHDGGSFGASVLDVPTDCQEFQAGVDRVTVYRPIREPVRVELLRVPERCATRLGTVRARV